MVVGQVGKGPRPWKTSVPEETPSSTGGGQREVWPETLGVTSQKYREEVYPNKSKPVK